MSMPAKPPTLFTLRRSTVPNADTEDLTGIPLVPWDALNTVRVQSAEVCSIVDIHPVRQASLPVRYYGKAATPDDTIIVATATFPDGRTKCVQRVMLG